MKRSRDLIEWGRLHWISKRLESRTSEYSNEQSNTEQVSAIQNALVSWHMKSTKERFPSLKNDLRNILVNELAMKLLYQELPHNEEGGKHMWDKVTGDLMKIVTLVQNWDKW